jgi:hypothetical protein
VALKSVSSWSRQPRAGIALEDPAWLAIAPANGFISLPGGQTIAGSSGSPGIDARYGETALVFPSGASGLVIRRVPLSPTLGVTTPRTMVVRLWDPNEGLAGSSKTVARIGTVSSRQWLVGVTNSAPGYLSLICGSTSFSAPQIAFGSTRRFINQWVTVVASFDGTNTIATCSGTPGVVAYSSASLGATAADRFQVGDDNTATTLGGGAVSLMALLPGVALRESALVALAANPWKLFKRRIAIPVGGSLPPHLTLSSGSLTQRPAPSASDSKLYLASSGTLVARQSPQAGDRRVTLESTGLVAYTT